MGLQSPKDRMMEGSVENQDFPHGEFVLPPKFAGCDRMED